MLGAHVAGISHQGGHAQLFLVNIFVNGEEASGVLLASFGRGTSLVSHIRIDTPAGADSCNAFEI